MKAKASSLLLAFRRSLSTLRRSSSRDLASLVAGPIAQASAAHVFPRVRLRAVVRRGFMQHVEISGDSIRKLR